MCSSGAKRTSAYTTPSLARSSAHSAATRTQRVLRLHHADGVLERLEVEVEVVAECALGEPPGELVDVGGGEGVSGLSCELDDRRRAQPSVEVVVQQHLGSPPDLVEGGCSHTPGYRR